MNSETCSPETANKTPEGYPGVFNTVIPYENFYLKIGANRLKAKDIIGMWRYIHNLFVVELKRLDITDKFGRMKAPADATLDKLYAQYWRNGLEKIELIPGELKEVQYLNLLAHAILQQLILSLTIDSAEWTRIYPVDMLVMPIVQDLNTIANSSTMTQFDKIPGAGNIGPFEFRLEYSSNYALRIDYDVKSRRNMLSIKMQNQYETEVFLDIKSNTKNFDDFINMVDDRIMSYGDAELDTYLNIFTLSFGLSRDMSRKRKLLLSVSSTELEKEE